MSFDYLILAGGRLPNPKYIKRLLKLSKSVITVDGGAHLALKLKLQPLLHVGDGDSFSFSKIKKLKAAAVLRLPKKKSISDLEFALSQLDATKTKLVLGAHADFEGRSDHAFMNLVLLSQTKNVYFADEKIWVIRLAPKKLFSFAPPKGTTFSIASFNRKNRISVSGSAYDVKNKALTHTTIGLSNVSKSNWVRIKSTGPSLLFVCSDIAKIDHSPWV